MENHTKNHWLKRKERFANRPDSFVHTEDEQRLLSQEFRPKNLQLLQRASSLISEPADATLTSIWRRCYDGSLKDVVFVAVDFEWCKPKAEIELGISNPIGEIGVATLDTRLLFDLSIDVLEIIKTENIRCAKTRYCQRTKNFLFGISQDITQDDIKDYLASKILIKDENGRYRNIVLVGNQIRAEGIAMERLGIDLRDAEEYPSIVGILDTRMLSCMVVEEKEEHGYDSNLGGILKELGISYRFNHGIKGEPLSSLHTAGNDANFTLKALLMIAARSMDGKCLNEDQKLVVAKLQAIAQVSVDCILSNTENDMAFYAAEAAKKHAKYIEHGLEKQASMGKARESAKERDWCDVLKGDAGNGDEDCSEQVSCLNLFDESRNDKTLP